MLWVGNTSRFGGLFTWHTYGLITYVAIVEAHFWGIQRCCSEEESPKGTGTKFLKVPNHRVPDHKVPNHKVPKITKFLVTKKNLSCHYFFCCKRDVWSRQFFKIRNFVTLRTLLLGSLWSGTLLLGTLYLYPPKGCRTGIESVPAGQQAVVGKMTTFDLWPIPLGWGAWGAGTNMWPQIAMKGFLPLWPHRFPHFGYIHLGGGGVGGLWY